jgi:hypothetical protein
MKNILLASFLFILTSCKAIMIRMMLKNPKVENTQTIKLFQTKNKYSTENSLILKGDTSNAKDKLFMGMTIGFYIFDKDGNQVCYNAFSTCRGVQFNELINNQIDSFKLCKSSNVSLDKILQQTYDLNENSVVKAQLDTADYYVVSYWQKFFGGKRGYKDAVTWMEKEIANNKSNLKFTFIKINTDLQENWGFFLRKKAKLKYEIKNGYMEFDVENLPFKK